MLDSKKEWSLDLDCLKVQRTLQTQKRLGEGLDLRETRGRKGLPWWLSGKEPTCNAGAARDKVSIPVSGRSPGEGNGNPLQYSCLENFTDREAWWAAVHGVAKS